MTSDADPLATPPGLPETIPAASAAPAAPPPETDRDGERFDPAKHRSPAKLNSRGRWERLRGNAALRAQGKPMTLFGKLFAGEPKPAAAPAPGAQPAAAPSPEPAPAAAPAGDLPPAWSGTPAVDGVPDPEAPPPELRPLEAYTATARSLTVAQFGIARMLFGDACKADPSEEKAWIDQWRDALHHWQVTPFGPILGLVILAINSIAKRVNEPSVRERARGLWRWMRRENGPPPAAYGVAPPPGVPAGAVPAPRPVTTPAPRAEVVNMAAYGR